MNRHGAPFATSVIVCFLPYVVGEFRNDNLKGFSKRGILLQATALGRFRASSGTVIDFANGIRTKADIQAETLPQISN